MTTAAMTSSVVRALTMGVLACVAALAHAGAFEDFFSALEVDNASTVKVLLERGFDVNAVDEKGQHALYVALRAESFRVAEVLLAQPGIKLDADNLARETPLMMAALRGNLEWTRKLLARGAAVHKEGWSAIHYAATGSAAEVVRLLLDRGAPADARSPNGSTPLMMAARYGSEDSVQLLMARGADVAVKNDRGLNAADFARLGGREALAARLAPPRQ